MAAITTVKEEFGDPFVTAQDMWMREEDRADVRAYLLGRLGSARAADMGVGIAIGLQMAEARRDG